MSRISEILRYKRENPGCDPNLYELVDVTNTMVKHVNMAAPNYGIYTQRDKYLKTEDGQPSDLAVYIDGYEQVYKANMDTLLNNDLGITEDSPLYRMMVELKGFANTLTSPPDYYASLAGVALYVAQQRRAVERGEISSVNYTNTRELEQLREQLTPVYKQLLASGKVRDRLHPEIDVYNDVFNEYVKSIGRGEHPFNLLSEHYIKEAEILKAQRNEKESNSFIDTLQSQVNETFVDPVDAHDKEKDTKSIDEI